MKEVYTDRAPKPIGPYSQGILADDLLFVSGQIPLDPSTGELVKGGMKEQARRALENLKEIIMAAGLSMDDVVYVQVFLKDLAQFEEFNEVYKDYFKRRPARVVVQVSELPKGSLLEVTAIATRRSD